MFLTVNTSRFGRSLRYKRTATKKVSLSTYFPDETQYFYGYPAGEDSGFLNKVPPSVEELVAARAFCCAGNNVSVVGFAATSSPIISSGLLKKFSIPRLSNNQVTLLPQEIDERVVGAERNRRIKDALVNSMPANSLVMAQPYSGDDMASIYQIPTKITRWLNDKSTMEQYIAKDLLPARFATYRNGLELAKSYKKLSLPVVVKASSSSAGDGVFICTSAKDLTAAVAELRNVTELILVEAYVDVHKNYGIHFGIPSSPDSPIDILGVNEQLTTPEGEFIGGIIRSKEVPEELTTIQQYLLDEVLPSIREMGWYGVGGFDVLLDRAGKFYFIDSNFRMTGMSAYHFMVANGSVKAPLLSFGGQFTGQQRELEKKLLPYAGKQAKQKILQLIALSCHGQTWDFNGALLFNTQQELLERIDTLIQLGVRSQALEQVSNQA